MLNNNEYQLEREDVFIETIAAEGFSAASDAGITVGLSLDLTQDLILEGIVRDIVRIIQSMRKKAGFAVEDRIIISWDFDGQIKQALGKFEDYFKSETLTNNIEKNIHGFDYQEIVEINEKKYKIKLKRSN
jgi:isoleucyl-tRNA synthetase